MKNKPYGWVKNGEYVLYIEKPDNVFSYTPLYTHQTKDLTEDEIKKCADSVCHTWKKNGVGELYMEDFARAILRKAQENPLQDKLDAIANKVVFGKAQEK